MAKPRCQSAARAGHLHVVTRASADRLAARCHPSRRFELCMETQTYFIAQKAECRQLKKIKETLCAPPCCCTGADIGPKQQAGGRKSLVSSTVVAASQCARISSARHSAAVRQLPHCVPFVSMVVLNFLIVHHFFPFPFPLTILFFAFCLRICRWFIQMGNCPWASMSVLRLYFRAGLSMSIVGVASPTKGNHKSVGGTAHPLCASIPEMKQPGSQYALFTLHLSKRQ